MSLEKHGVTVPAPELCPPLLELRRLSKCYLRGGWPSARVVVKALDNIHLTLRDSSVLAIVGKSGSGKSTLARCLVFLERPNSGELRFEGIDVLSLNKNGLKAIRTKIQLVFQQPATAMNPLLSALDIVAEPLLIQHISKRESCERALAALEEVDIDRASVGRKPLDFSGGQRQRIAIARALILQPKLLVLDEPFSGLDLITQTQIVDLLARLRTSLAMTFLLISHDLCMAAHLADTIAVIESGRIVESGTVASLLSHPWRKETRELVDSIPELLLDPRQIVTRRPAATF